MNQKPCCGCPKDQDICKGECMCHHSPKPESEWDGFDEWVATAEPKHIKAHITANYVSKAEIAEVVEGSTQRPYQEGGSVEYMTKYEEGYNTALEDIKRKFDLY